jgi:gliding motility-associated-like protein
LNDLFLVKANFEPRNFDLTIFNRNGELLFRSHDISIGWDGQLHGSTLPQGMYVYVIKYKDHNGNDQKKQGQILLIP